VVEVKWRLLVAGGGTGGHVFPGISVAESARSLGAEVMFAGRKGGPEAAWVGDAGLAFRGLPASGMPRGVNPLSWALFFVNLARGLWGAFRLTGAFRPDAVFSTGGYASAAVSVAAFLRGVPVVLLEPNVKPGLAAKALSPFAKRVCVGFEEAAGKFPRNKTVVTGIPVRAAIREARREPSREAFGLPQKPLTVLLLGGSQGAHGLNLAFTEAVRYMGEGVQPAQFIFMTGRDDFRSVTGQLEGCTAKVVTRPFIANIHEAYAASDLLIARSGAMTCAEAASRGLPAIFVPYPHAGRHQEMNARALERAGAAVVVTQKEAVKGALLKALISLVNDRKRLLRMSEAARAWGRPDAARDIAGILRQLAVGR